MSKRLAKSYTRLVLEKRIVFDAAAVQTAAEISDVVDSAETDALVDDLSSTQDNIESEILFDILTAPATQTDFSRSILIVDSRVENLEGLLVDLASNTDVFILDTNTDGIEQINSILANYNNLSSLQILSHADDASLVLGSTVLNNNNIDSYADTLNNWGNALSDSGDILLFGCDVANSADGLAFIQSLADYTNADVAASTDDTGAGSQGGDWDLEVQTGSIETDSVLSEQVIAQYDGLLATITFDGGAGTAFWDDAANWSGDTLPAVGDDVILNGVTVTVRDTQLINTLSLTNGSSLTIDAASSFTLINGGNIDATSSLDGDGAFQLNGGSFNNDGIIRINAGSIDLANGANFVNDTNSQIYINASSGLVISDTTGTAGVFTNNGLVSTNANNTPAIIDANFVNNSIIALGRNATGSLVFQGTLDSSNGLIIGIGTLDLSAASVSGIGTIDPGFGVVPIGQLNVIGDVSLSPTSLLKVNLDSSMPDSDTIMVSGNVTLDGTLSIAVANGFTPTVGQAFSLIGLAVIDTGFIDNGLNIVATTGYQFASNIVNNGTELQIVTIAIPAVAANDNLNVNEDTTLTITETDLLANDTDIVSIISVTQPANGMLNIDQQTGDYIYTPNANFNGADSFTYTGVDLQANQFTATVNITVNSVADTVTWTNTTGDNRWETAGNWDLGFVPLNGDNVIVPELAGSIIFSSGTVTLNTLISSENDFQITGGSLLLGDDAFDISSFNVGSIVTLSGGELGGLGTTSLDGDLTFSGGVISGNVNIGSTATLLFSNLFSNSDLTGTLNNSGTVEFSSNGSRLLGGTINNTSIGTIDFSNNLTLTVDLGNSSILNKGLIVKSAGTGESVFNVVAGSALNFSGSGVFDAGGGFIAIDGDTNYAADFTASGNMGSGALRLNSGLHTFATGSSFVNGDFVFRGGTIAGELSIASDAKLTFNDLFRNSDLTGTLNNAGTIEFASNGSRINGGTINNTGVIDFTNNLTLINASGTATIVNNGSIIKTGGASESLLAVTSGIGFNFSGNGIFDSRTGLISIEGDTRYAANFTASGGTGSNAFRIGNGTHDFGVGSQFNNGNFIFRGGEISGELSIDNTASLVFNDLFRNSDLTGTLNNAGTIEFATNATRLLGATINNTGNIDFSNNLTVTVDASATAIVNNGSITKSAGLSDSIFNILAGSAINFSGNGVFDAQAGMISLEGDANYATNFSATGGSGASALRISSGLHSFGAGSSFNNGVFIFRGGEIAGDLTVANDARLIFNDLFRNSDLTGTITNAGTVEFATNASRLQGGTLDNQLGGVVEFSANSTITVESGVSTIVNNGSFIKTAGTGDSLFNILAGSAINFSGAGSYDAGQGTLSIEGDANYASDFTASGGVGPNALRLSSGTHTFSTGSSFNNGNFTFRGGEIAGELAVNNGAKLVFNNLFRNSDLTGTLNNLGTVEFATNGSRILGGTLNNQLGGIVDFSADLAVTANFDPETGTLNPTVVNNGSFIKTAGTGDSLFSVAVGSAINFGGAGSYDAGQGTLSIDGDANYAADFSASGGVGPNALRLSGGIHTFTTGSSFNNGNFTFRGGEIAGELDISNGATLVFNYLFSNSDLTGILNNSGMVEFASNGSRILGGTLNNELSGIVNFSADLTLTTNVDPVLGTRNASIINNGTFIKTAGGGDSLLNATSGSVLDLSGNGIFEAQTGTMSINGNVDYATNFSASGVAGGNSLRITGGVQTFGANSSFNDGVFEFRGGEIAGDLTVAANADLDVTNAFSISNFSGTVNNAGALNLISNNIRLLGATISNSGTVTVSTTLSDIRNSTLINTGTIDFTNDSSLINTSGILTISNDGSIIKTGGTGDSQIRVTSGQGFAVSGNGIIDARTGFISINGNTTYANNFTVTGGTGPNSLRINSGIQNFGVGSSFNSGNFVFRSGDIAGELSIASDATLLMNDNFGFSDISGTLNNAGILQVTANNVRVLGGTINNTSSFSTSNNITFSSGAFNNTGTVDFTADGDFINTSGTLTLVNNGSIIKTAGAGDSQIRLAGGTDVALSGNGIIDARTGFISINGNTTYANNFTVTGGTGPNSLRINSGIQTFGVGSSFNNGNFVFRSGDIAGELSIASDATLLMNDNFGFSDISGTLNNAGSVQISANNTRIVGGTFNNLVSGTLEFTNDSDLTTLGNAPALTNAGTILKSGGAGVSAIIGTPTFSNNGGVIDAQSGTLQIPASITSSGYVLQGNGTIDLSGTTAPITDIRPGRSASGILNVNGGIDLDPTTNLTIDIGGANVGLDYDQLTLNGVANFNGGSVDVSFLNNYEGQITVGQVFTIATYTSSTGVAQGLTVNASNVPLGLLLRLNDTGTALQLIVDNNQAPTAVDDSGALSTARVSVDGAGNGGNLNSLNPNVSADGRFVVFSSRASNLVTGDTNGSEDIFLTDLQTGTTILISVDSQGNQTNNRSFNADISADGRFITFASFADNLVANDTNNISDIFLHDTQTGITTLISVDSNGNQANGMNMVESSVSDDGRFVAFSSTATNLVSGDTNGRFDVFLRDTVMGTTTRISTDSAGNELFSDSGTPEISGDGRFVAFNSFAANLVAGDTNGTFDTFVKDLQTGAVTPVSVDSAGNTGNGFSGVSIGISTDGRFVVFDSAASNLVTGDTNAASDIFVRDMQTGVTTRVSVNSVGGEGNGASTSAGISADGRFVVYESSSTNLVVDDTNGVSDVFVYDRQTGITSRATVDSAGNQSASVAGSFTPNISSNGDAVFSTRASDLVPGDTNNLIDVFIRSLSNFSTDENTAFTTSNVLNNDADPDGDTLTVIAIDTALTAGTVVNNNDGTFSYDPNGAFSSLTLGQIAMDGFTYTVSDGNGGTSTATVTIAITGTNLAPVANDDTVVTDSVTSVSFNVLNNDFDPEEQNVSVLTFNQPANGVLVEESNGSFTYTANAGYEGVDMFTYTITDGAGGSDVAVVSINVLPTEDVSTRGGDISTTDVFTGPIVTFTQGANGTVTQLFNPQTGDSTFTYQGNQNFRGPDSFTVTRTISGVSYIQTINVTVYNNTVNQQWTGQAANGDWSDPNNWSLGLTPADGDSIAIPDGVDTIVFATGGNITLDSLILSDTLIVQSGSITVLGLDAQGATTDTVIQNNGVLDIAAGQTFTVSGGDFINNGTINGKGTLDVMLANSFINNGILSPGNSPGTLTVNGDFTQTSSGTIVLEIAGLTPGTQYDQLIVNGTATLNGTVNIVLLNGFVLPANGNFQLISATTIVGSPIINTPAGVTFDLFTGNTTSNPLGGFTGTGTFTFGPTTGSTGGYISISNPSYTYDPIQVNRTGSSVTPIVYRTATDAEWTGVIDDLTVALVDEGTSNDELVAEFERLLESDPTAAGETLSEYELKLEQQLELSISQFSKEQLAVLDILLQTPDTLSCR